MSETRRILGGTARGAVLATAEPLSFWGGIDPATARVMDVHHPLHGAEIAGRILTMPTTRGSCTGSGVLLDLALSGRAPAALVFKEAEDVVTLGALIAAELFGRPVPVLRLAPDAFAAVAASRTAEITETAIRVDGRTIPLDEAAAAPLALSADDRAMRDGRDGPAVALAMRVIVEMARLQGAERLIDVTRAHIDGCIYASPANLTFAETMVDMGARVRVPTTMNAISVDRAHWQAQGVPPNFGGPAARLADAYVHMGCQPTFTCAPYLLEDAPRAGEAIAWAEFERRRPCQQSARRAHRQAPGFPRPLHRPDRAGAAFGRLSRRRPGGAAGDRRRLARRRRRCRLAACRLSRRAHLP